MTARVAITGAGGQLGRYLVGAFTASGDDVLALVRPDFDITRDADLEGLAAWRPDIVVNSAAWTDVDACARDPERALAVNGAAAGALAAVAQRAGALSVQISTNEVFDGALDRPYTEDDPPSPINPYGRSKLAGERAVAAANPRHLVVRTAWIFSPDSGFPARIRAAADRAASDGKPLRVVEDEWGNPTPAEWLASAVTQLIAHEIAQRASSGVYHAAGQPATTRKSWAQAVLFDHPVAVEPIGLEEYRRDSRVPPRAVLDTTRLARLGIEPADWGVVTYR